VKSESHSTVAEAVVPQAGFRKERSTVAEAVVPQAGFRKESKF